MSKMTHKVAGKGILDVNFNEGYGTITFIDKNGGETVWDFFKIIEDLNGKTVSYSFTEENDIEPISEA
ncbi:YonK family protein [Lederbergia citrisecunda]|uniref:YonK family protein n=1 Tax=Lederbergia citrisecunda TaxID=2833583 RepID=UPI003D2AB5FE